MVVTCVAFTRSLPATAPLPELPIDAAATGHLDPRYLAGSRIRTGRLPAVVVDFRGRPIGLGARVLHHRRVDLVDVVLEVSDAEAATYLEAFDRTSAAAAAELFRRDGDRRSIADLHDELAAGLLGQALPPGHGSGFTRLIFSRGPDGPRDAAPGIVAGHRVTAATERIVVHGDTTVLPDERLGYEMIAGLSVRSGLLIDQLIRSIDRLALASGDHRADHRALLDEAAETQRRAVVLQREVAAQAVLAPALRPTAEAVDEVVGPGAEGRRDLEQAVASLGRLTGSLFARSLEHRIHVWERAAGLALLLLVVLTTVVVLQAVP